MSRKLWALVLIGPLVIAIILLGYKSGWWFTAGNTHTLPTGPLPSQAAATQGESMVSILVAQDEINPYSHISDSSKFKQVKYPESTIRENVEDTITSFDQIKGKYSRHYKLRANEPMYKNDFTDKMNSEHSDQPPRATELAHTLLLPIDRYPADMFKPGDYIDIVASALPEEGKTSAPEKSTLLNIEVLKAAAETRKDRRTNLEKQYTCLVLRVTPPQSLLLKFYSDAGKIEITGHRQKAKE